MLRGGGEPAPDVQNLIDELHGVLGGKPVVAPKPVAAPIAATRVAAMGSPRKTGRRRAHRQHPRQRRAAQYPGQSDGREQHFPRPDRSGRQRDELQPQRVGANRHPVAPAGDPSATQAEARIQSRRDTGAKAHQLEFDPLELDRFTELQQLSRSLMEIADDLGNVGNTLGEQTREVGSLLDQQAKVNKEIQQGLMRTGMVRFGSIVRGCGEWCGRRPRNWASAPNCWSVARRRKSTAPYWKTWSPVGTHAAQFAGAWHRGAGTASDGREARNRHHHPEPASGRRGTGAGTERRRRRPQLTQSAPRARKRLLLPEQPASQEELIALLLRPGFSTAKAVTQIAGRGVGMDVVNAAIRAMRGALLIQTEPGQGSRFIVRLPFSLAVTQALLAKAGNAIFAIPLLSIELVTRIQESAFKLI